jgi:hypothetical protein
LAITINEGPTTTFYGHYDATATGPVIGAPGLDTTKVPILFNSSNVKFVRYNLTTTAGTDTLQTGIGGLVNGVVSTGRIVMFAIAPDYTDPTASTAGQGTNSFTASIGGSGGVDSSTGNISITGTAATKTFNLLIWYV